MNKQINPDIVWKPSDKVVPRKIKDTLIIVPIENGMANFNDVMFSFNETGTKIWECIEQKLSYKKICSTLAAEYEADLDRIEQGVMNLLNELLEKGIVEEWKN